MLGRPLLILAEQVEADALATLVVTTDRAHARHATILGGGGDKRAIRARGEELRRALERSTSDYEREKLQERRARRLGRRQSDRSAAPSSIRCSIRGRSPGFHSRVRCDTRYTSGPPSGDGLRSIGRGMHTNSVSSSSGVTRTVA